MVLARLDQQRARAQVTIAKDAFVPKLFAGSGAAYTNGFPMSIDGNAPAVWIVRASDNALELRRVQVARYDERTISVSQGLNDGDRVVLQGVHTVSAGEKVHAVPPLHPEDFAS